MSMFGKNLQKACSQKSVKQVDLAYKLGVPATTVNGWMCGRHEPSIDMLLKVCEYLDIPVGVLISDKRSLTPVTLYSMSDDFEKLAKVSLMQKEYIEKLEKELSDCDTAIEFYSYLVAMKKAGAKELTIKLQ